LTLLKKLLPYVALLILAFVGQKGYCQVDSMWGSRHRVIQLSGLVVSGDSSYGVPGVSVYVPKAGRGAITSNVGYFSFPVISGDSVVVKSLGYKEKNFIVPAIADDKLSIIVELMEDTLIMPVVEIFPYPTEKLFKEAILSLKLPEQDLDNMHKNLNEQVMKRMLYTMDHDGTMNHKYYMQQQVYRQETKMMNPAYNHNFFNPFAWGKFIQSIKNGDLKIKQIRKDIKRDSRTGPGNQQIPFPDVHPDHKCYKKVYDQKQQYYNRKTCHYSQIESDDLKYKIVRRDYI
jgi:hypothetical protein